LVLAGLSLTIIISSMLVYAFSSVSFGPFHDPDSRRFTFVHIDDLTRDAEGMISFLVQNDGKSNVTLSGVYVNDILDGDAVGEGITLMGNETVKINMTYPNTDNEIRVKVSTTDNCAFMVDRIFYRMDIQCYEWSRETGCITVFVRNVGEEEVVLSEVYINGTLDSAANFSRKVIPSGLTSTVTLSEKYVSIPNSLTTIRVVTDRGYTKELIGYNLPRWFWIGGFDGEATWSSASGQVKIPLLCGVPGRVVFGDVYVNGTLDDSAVFSQKEFSGLFETAELTLSGYVTKPDAVEVAVFITESKFVNKLLVYIDEVFISHGSATSHRSYAGIHMSR
jgi:hypothetical protein